MSPSNQPSREVRLRELLFAARKSAGLLQAELSDRLGRPQTFVSKYERGEKSLRVVEFMAVTEAIGCSAEDIIATLRAISPEGGGPNRRPKNGVKPG